MSEILAQLVEHLTFNQVVGGSTPPCLTKIKNPPSGGFFICCHFTPHFILERYMIFYISRDSFAVKGGESQMAWILTFLVSVMASIVAYYICKWLDG